MDDKPNMLAFTLTVEVPADHFDHALHFGKCSADEFFASAVASALARSLWIEWSGDHPYSAASWAIVNGFRCAVVDSGPDEQDDSLS